MLVRHTSYTVDLYRQFLLASFLFTGFIARLLYADVFTFTDRKAKSRVRIKGAFKDV